jgi:hypothetical protein
MTAPADQRIFMLTLIGRPGDDPIHGIRALLKLALRRYGLRCVNAREIAPPQSPQPDRTQAHDHNDSHSSRRRIDRGANPTSGGDRRQRASREDPREKPKSLAKL